MTWFKNLPLGRRIGLAFGVVLLLMAGVVGLGIQRMGLMDEGLDTLAQTRMAQVRLANEIIDLANANGRATYRVVATDVSELPAIWAEVEERKVQISARFDTLDAITDPGGDGQAAFDALSEVRDEYVAAFTEIFDVVREGDLMRGTALLDTSLEPALGAFLERNGVLIDYYESAAAQQAAEAGAAYRSSRALLLLVLLGAILVGAGFGVVVARDTGGSVARLLEMMRDLGRGRLSHRLEMDRTDEMGELAAAMDTFARNLQEKMLATFDALSRGDLSVEIHRVDERDEIAPVMQRTRDGLQALVDEGRALSEAGRRGDLSVRADVGRLEGAFADVVGGMNDTLDAVVRPMEEAADVLDRVAARDLSARVEGEYRGDHAKIKKALNTAVENLDRALQEVAGASEQVASASGQITSSSQELAQGTSEQASSLEEVSSSLQELSSMSQQNSGNAQEASGIARESVASLEEASGRMEELSRAVEAIKGSSDDTAKIVKTIDEIAFQTNLLALNAAVEAARAGDAGQGFAVVAEEVRNLAMRSAEAAKDTAALIEQAVENAESGVSLNKEVLESLGELGSRTRRSTEVIAEIAAASEQQSQGVDQINGAVEQMNAVTQQTAASSEEGASTAEELSAQAEQLRTLVSGFRLSRSGVRRSGPSVEPTAAAGHPDGADQRSGNGAQNRVASSVGVDLLPFDDGPGVFEDF